MEGEGVSQGVNQLVHEAEQKPLVQRVYACTHLCVCVCARAHAYV